jgi:hypothetical protein
MTFVPKNNEAPRTKDPEIFESHIKCPWCKEMINIRHTFGLKGYGTNALVRCWVCKSLVRLSSKTKVNWRESLVESEE